MPEQTHIPKPEIIAFPGDNAELPAKSLERQIYTESARYQQALKLGTAILGDTIELPPVNASSFDDEEKLAKAKSEFQHNETLNEAKLLVSDNLKTILNDEKLRRSIWFDEHTEARMDQDEEFNRLKRAHPRTEKVLKEMRLRQFAIFVDSVIEYQSQQEPQKSRLRRTG